MGARLGYLGGSTSGPAQLPRKHGVHMGSGLEPLQSEIGNLRTISTWRARVVVTRPKLYLQPKQKLANSSKGLIRGL